MVKHLNHLVPSVRRKHRHRLAHITCFQQGNSFPCSGLPQLTSTCSSRPGTWPVHSCIKLQAASVQTVQPALWQLGKIAAKYIQLPYSSQRVTEQILSHYNYPTQQPKPTKIINLHHPINVIPLGSCLSTFCLLCLRHAAS